MKCASTHTSCCQLAIPGKAKGEVSVNGKTELLESTLTATIKVSERSLNWELSVWTDVDGVERVRTGGTYTFTSPPPQELTDLQSDGSRKPGFYEWELDVQGTLVCESETNQANCNESLSIETGSTVAGGEFEVGRRRDEKGVVASVNRDNPTLSTTLSGRVKSTAL